jgi:hypothetical protein
MSQSPILPTPAAPARLSEREILLTLFDLGRQVASVIAFDELLQKIPELIGRLIPFDAFALYLLDDKRDVLTIGYSVGYPDTTGFELQTSEGEVGRFNSNSEMNRKIHEALDLVAKKLGNTRAVCKKYYVHPVIINLYQGRELDRYITKLNKVETEEDSDGYIPEEKILLKILRDSLKDKKKL